MLWGASRENTHEHRVTYSLRCLPNSSRAMCHSPGFLWSLEPCLQAWGSPSNYCFLEYHVSPSPPWVGRQSGELYAAPAIMPRRQNPGDSH